LKKPLKKQLKYWLKNNKEVKNCYWCRCNFKIGILNVQRCKDDCKIFASNLINDYSYYYDKNKINIYDFKTEFPFSNHFDIIIINDIYNFDNLLSIINNVISSLVDDGMMIIETSAQNINKLENAFPHKYEIKRLETSMIISKK